MSNGAGQEQMPPTRLAMIQNLVGAFDPPTSRPVTVTTVSLPVVLPDPNRFLVGFVVTSGTVCLNIRRQTSNTDGLTFAVNAERWYNFRDFGTLATGTWYGITAGAGTLLVFELLYKPQR